MTKSSATFAAIAAGVIFSTTPVFAAITSLQGSMMIADIGRDTVELSRSQEVLPTVSDINVSYPELQRALGVHGSTVVAVGLDEKGNLTKTSVYKSSGNKVLDRNAIFAVQLAKFQPGKIAGIPVSGEYSVRVDYNDER